MFISAVVENGAGRRHHDITKTHSSICLYLIYHFLPCFHKCHKLGDFTVPQAVGSFASVPLLLGWFLQYLTTTKSGLGEILR